MDTLEVQETPTGMLLSLSGRHVEVEIHLAAECNLREIVLRRDVQDALRRLLDAPDNSTCHKLTVNDRMNRYFDRGTQASDLEALRLSGRTRNELRMSEDPLSLPLNGHQSVQDRIAHAIIALTPATCHPIDSLEVAVEPER